MNRSRSPVLSKTYSPRRAASALARVLTLLKFKGIRPTESPYVAPNWTIIVFVSAQCNCSVACYDSIGSSFMMATYLFLNDGAQLHPNIVCISLNIFAYLVYMTHSTPRECSFSFAFVFSQRIGVLYMGCLELSK